MSFSIIDRRTEPPEPLPGRSDTEWIITTPNMPFVPRISLREREVHARQDGRYGLDDFIVHPQKFSAHLRHLSAIRRCPAHNVSPASIMWWTPTVQDWASTPGSIYSCVGLLLPKYTALFKKAQLDLYGKIRRFFDKSSSPNPFLDILASDLRHARIRLELCPGSFREVLQGVTQFQRLFLETLAYLDWYEEFEPRAFSPGSCAVETDVMGCWSDDPMIVQRLEKAGIPVWFIRSGDLVAENMVCHASRVEMQVDAKVVEKEYINENGKDDPFPVIYRGRLGSNMLEAVRSQRPFYIDHPLAIAEQRQRIQEGYINPIPIPSQQMASTPQAERSAGPIRNSQRNSRKKPCKCSLMSQRFVLIIV